MQILTSINTARFRSLIFLNSCHLLKTESNGSLLSYTFPEKVLIDIFLLKTIQRQSSLVSFLKLTSMMQKLIRVEDTMIKMIKLNKAAKCFIAIPI